MAKRIVFTETERENIGIEAFLNKQNKIWINIIDSEDNSMGGDYITLELEDAKEFAELILSEIKLSENE